MIVRKIRKNELSDLLELYKHLHPDDLAFPQDFDLAKHWKSILENQCLHYFIAEYDGKIVSSCALAVIPNLTRGAKPYGVIENVVTHENYRRKGFARAVVKRALNYAWENNCYKVMLLSGKKRKEAHGLYERLGFSKESKIGYVAKPK
jgi:GNAT superfamily N-acetyltransferase